MRLVGTADQAWVGDLINAHALPLTGTRRALIDAHGDLRTARYIPWPAERYVALVDGRDAIAFLHLFSAAPHVVVEIGCLPLSGFESVSESLMAWLIEQARRLAQPAPEGARVVVQTTILADDAAAARLLVDSGFERVREWVHFELTLDEPPVITLPDGVTIRVMDPRVDWPAVGAAMDEAFADHWGEMGPDVRTLLEEDEPADEADDSDDDEDDPYFNSLGLCFVAEADGQVIGSCLCNARTVEWPDAGKLGSLSVRRAWRGQGVGHALTAAALAEFHRRGVRRVITDTDSASFTGANRLYPRFGFRPYRYEYVYEKEIRPGIEWRTLSLD